MIILVDPKDVHQSNEIIIENKFNYTRSKKTLLHNNFLVHAVVFSEFSKLKKRLLQETMYESDPQVIYQNKNYLAILKLGKGVEQFLLNDLIENKTDWFLALTKLYNIDPVKVEHYGNMDAMILDWIEWKNNIEFL
jgi:hypothetical protein